MRQHSELSWPACILMLMLCTGPAWSGTINGERVTLKKFYVEADGIRLQPANPDMAPIRLKNDEVQILGIVTGVIRLADAE